MEGINAGRKRAYAGGALIAVLAMRLQIERAYDVDNDDCRSQTKLKEDIYDNYGKIRSLSKFFIS